MFDCLIKDFFLFSSSYKCAKESPFNVKLVYTSYVGLGFLAFFLTILGAYPYGKFSMSEELKKSSFMKYWWKIPGKYVFSFIEVIPFITYLVLFFIQYSQIIENNKNTLYIPFLNFFMFEFHYCKFIFLIIFKLFLNYYLIIIF